MRAMISIIGAPSPFIVGHNFLVRFTIVPFQQSFSAKASFTKEACVDSDNGPRVLIPGISVIFVDLSHSHRLNYAT
jgi:hypothetical protein